MSGRMRIPVNRLWEERLQWGYIPGIPMRMMVVITHRLRFLAGNIYGRDPILKHSEMYISPWEYELIYEDD